MQRQDKILKIAYLNEQFKQKVDKFCLYGNEKDDEKFEQLYQLPGYQDKMKQFKFGGLKQKNSLRNFKTKS